MSTQMVKWQDVGKEIGKLVYDGIDSWLRAGEMVAEVLAADDAPTVEALADSAGLSPDIVRRFEQIGRREIYPQLLAHTSEGARKLASCSYREQKQYMNDSVPVAIVRDGDVDVLDVKVDSLTREQCRQVFASHHVRNISEQRAWIETQAQKERERRELEAAEIYETPYHVKGKRVLFRKGAELSRKELVHLLNELEG